jgi:hypothetical protein
MGRSERVRGIKKYREMGGGKMGLENVGENGEGS